AFAELAEEEVDVPVEAELGSDRERLAARAADRGDGLARRGFVPAVVHGDPRTVRRQSLGDGAADAARRAGDARSLACQTTHGVLLDSMLGNVPLHKAAGCMLQRVKRRRRRSSAEMREHVLDVTHPLFYWEGIRAVGVDRIADEAGIAPTTLYRLFESKD